MKHSLIALATLFAGLFAAPSLCLSQPPGAVADKPLFRDPVYNGAADPVVVWNPLVQRWWMFYTNRRANVAGLEGVEWVHGTPIGIAESSDGGVRWSYVGTADIGAPKEAAGEKLSYWAPDVVRGDDGRWHMFLTVVPGVFRDWDHPRSIVHLTSADLRSWSDAQPIELASDRVIDACVLQMPDSTWRMWYNNERDGKSIYLAESPNLRLWQDRGKVISDRGCEAPKVFRWRNYYWMIVDAWDGLGVYRSEYAERWARQPQNLLREPGRGMDDQVKGGHADVVVSGDRAFLFYFTHPGRSGANADKDGADQRRSSIQVVELNMESDWLTCDRDNPTYINLLPPSQ